MSFWAIAALVGTLVVIGLAFYAGKLLFMLKAQKQKEQAFLADHNEKLLKSIRIIAASMLEEQCDFSEGAIRIRVLTDHLLPYKSYQEQFPALFDLYDRVKDMPTHEARNNMDKKERRQQDRQREAWERELAAAIKEEARVLKNLTH